MTLEFFNGLSDEEKTKALQNFEALETLNKDQEAEIASFKSENETLKAGTEKLEKELKETKELNFTLARKVDTSNYHPSFEDTLQEMFYPQRREK